MNFRVLLLTTACVALAGIVAAPVVLAQTVTVKNAKVVSNQDGVPEDLPQEMAVPQLLPGDISTDPEVLLTQSSDETMERIAKHFKKIYGSEAGPLAELEEKEKQVEAARKKVAVYSMTEEQRAAYFAEEERLRREAEGMQGQVTSGKKSDKMNDRKPWAGYGVSKSPATPPRLFNNAQ